MAKPRPAVPRARRRCATCGAAVRANDRFCATCGTPLEAVTSAPPAFASASLQVAGVESGSLGEQRKVVTILFADLSGSTALGERLDPEELRGILTSYFNELSRQIQRYEGTIDKYIGDAVMAVFGAPISHEDDAERAINAALAMQSSITRLNDGLERRHGVRLTLRIGINTGEVVAGLLAGEVQHAYTVVGDAVNTAQRYESAAPPGEVLVSATTRRLAIHSFEFEETAPLTLKGKAERVVAYRVLRRRYEEIAPEASLFIGRAHELQILRAAVVDAIEGHGRVLSIVGEAGVGKSRLVGELRAGLVAGVDRITVRCASFEANTPYALIADFVRGAFSIRAADDEPTARAAIVNGFTILGQPIDETSVLVLLDVLGYGERSTFDPEVKRRVLVSLLGTLLRLAGARTPFVLTAEDLHWVDGASLRVLNELVPVVRALPALFITTARPGWTAPWKAELVELRALDEADSRSFVEAIFEVPVDEPLAQMILTRTSGNPFFMEEVIRELQASTLLMERAGRVGLRADAVVRVPETVQEVIEARLDRLAASTRRVLNPAAVCGRTFWSRVLERLVPELPVADHLATLEREAFIALRSVAPEVTYAFRQILIQEVAYETQLHAVRRRTHGQVAAAIEALYADRLDEFVDFLAYHYERSDEGTKAVRYLLLAGQRAKHLFANEEALRSFGAALALAAEPSERAGALEGIGDVRATLGELAPSRESYESAMPLVTDAVGRARLQRKIAFTSNRAGDYRGAETMLRRALAEAGEVLDAEVAAIWLNLAEVTWRQDRFDEAIVACAKGIEVAKAAGARREVANGFRHLGLAHLWKGERTIAAEHFRRALELYESLGDLPGLVGARNNLGIVYRREARWSDALHEQEEGLRIARRIGDAWMTATVLGNMGEVYRYQGDLDRGLASYEEALQLLHQIGDAVGVALMHMNIGIVKGQRGESAEGRARLETALAEFERLDSRRWLPELYRALAAVELERDPVAAIRWAHRAVDLAREIKARDEEAVALALAGEIRARTGDLGDAIRDLRAAAVLLRASNDQRELARVLSLLADALRRDHAVDEADAVLREAAALHAAPQSATV